MRRLLLLVGAIVFVDTMFFAALTPLLPHYEEELGLGKTGAGILQAAYPAGAFLGSIPGGMLAARVGVRPTVLGGLATLSLTSLAFGVADTAWQLDLARFFQGISSALSWTGALAWLVGAAPPGQRGRLIGTAMGVAIGGALFGPVLGGIASYAGSPATFAGVAVLGLGLVGWAARTPSAPPERPQPLSALLAALRTSRLLAAVWLVTLPALLFGTLSVLGPLRLSELGFGALAIAAIWMTSASLEALAAPGLGHLSDRVGRRRPLLGSLGAAGVMLALVPWPANAYLLGALIVVASIAFGSFWTPAMALLSDAGEELGLSHGYAMALVNLAWAPGHAGGAAVGGAVAAATADAVPYLALAVVCALTLAALWRSGSSS